jgi:hypothetical protein
MAQAMDISEIKRLYPDEWVLLGNQVEVENSMDVLSGVLLYHSPDKREVCCLGRELVKGYDKTYLFFNRVTPRTVRRIWLGPLRRIGEPYPKQTPDTPE